MVIMTFGSGLDMENTDPAYMDRIRELVEYAHSKGIELGGYSLLASRRISDQHDVIHPQTGKPGGALATLEPLSEHLDAYGAHLAQNFGAGVQACYRGPRLYDTEETKALVQRWAAFYKSHRAILDSDIIHVRRPDGRDIDGILHVNPDLKTKGLALVYNPLSHPVERELILPLYYTGLTEVAMIREGAGEPRRYPLDRRHNTTIPLRMAPHRVAWLTIE